MKILIVDDSVMIRRVIQNSVEKIGYQSIEAKDGQEALEIIEKNYKDIILIVLDWNMPILDGYQAFKQIKEIDTNANVVIVTGFSEFEPKSQEAIKDGLIKVISKPLGVDELLELAKKYSEIKV